MASPWYGEIKLVAFDFAPAGSRPALISTRPATTADEPLLRELFALTHFSASFGPPSPDPVWNTLLDVQYRARALSRAARYPHAEDRIVVADGDPVGRVLTAVQGDVLRVVDIAVWPRAQRRGIGSAVVRGLQQSVTALELDVANDHRAVADWYRRLGFREVASDVMYTAMRWDRAEPVVPSSNKSSMLTPCDGPAN